jgi:glycosyltransferase EpsE
MDRCIAEARGELLARQDGDDISEADRLTKLVNAMDADPEIAVVSSWMTSFDETGVWGEVRTKPLPVADDFLFGPPICHAPCMMRKAAVVAVGGYGAERWILRCEDAYLWFRLYAAGYKAKNLQEALYRVRDDQSAHGRRNLSQRLNGVRVLWRGFALLGIPLHKRVWAIRPILTWAIPNRIYIRMRRARQSKRLK